jgi:hypothetical protein
VSVRIVVEHSDVPPVVEGLGDIGHGGIGEGVDEDADGGCFIVCPGSVPDRVHGQIGVVHYRSPPILNIGGVERRSCLRRCSLNIHRSSPCWHFPFFRLLGSLGSSMLVHPDSPGQAHEVFLHLR